MFGAVLAASAGLGVLGALSGAKGAKETNALAQQGIAQDIENNRLNTIEKLRDVRRQRAYEGSEVVARAAGSGVSVDSASVQRALEVNAAERATEEIRVRQEAESIDARLRTESAVRNKETKYARRGAFFSAAGSILGAGAMYYGSK